ncbi:MAG: response regulator [Treponema sp.]|jgi:signal transduction histidine kinase/DNA-binding response OmpR family regulator|nr:response regulator [Treponema sp.]
MRLNQFVQRYFFSGSLSLKERRLNMFLFAGLWACLVAVISRSIFQYNWAIFIVMSGMTVSVALLFFFVNLFGLHKPGVWFFLLTLCDILFPIAFFLLGGVDGNMSSYFVLSIVVIFLLAEGPSLVILLVTHLLLLGLCYYLNYRFPGMVIPAGQFKYADQIQSFLVPGFYIGIIFKLQEVIYRRMNREIKRRDQLLRTVNLAATELLKSDPANFERDIWDCMGMMAGAVDVDTVYIWKNFIKNDSLYTRLLYEWEEDTSLEKSKAVNLELSGEDIPGWNEKLLKGECFQGAVKNVDGPIRKRLEEQNIVSMLIIPVFLQDYFWGFVGFDDKTNERKFADDEIAILKSGSLLIANAMQRNDMTQNLIRVREEALSNTRAKSDFLANMSHEMRTPMNAIIGMTNIAMGARDLEKKNYCLSKIADASNHLLGVINDILDMSKIEANKFELSLLEFNFEKTLRKAVNVINFRVEEKRQHFIVKLGRNIPSVFIGDDQRLTQVITNLLSNAVKFTPEEGEICLEARLLEESADGFCTMQIEVADSGIGISVEQKDRLFRSFEQADSNTSRRFGGTGLGLAISKSIVELMGGRIWVESEAGKGSHFFFTVRMEKRKGEWGPLSPFADWNNIRILVVDDVRDVLEYFEEIARRFKLACDTAISGEDAVVLIEKNDGYDIYFVDWRMPGMDGIALTRFIKSVRKDRPSVVIMISANEWTSIEDEAKTAGVDKFLAKPIFPSSIADIINSCLGFASIREKEKQVGEIVQFPGKRILLAEDIEINREIVLALLEPARLVIDCAVNGRQALDMFNEAPDTYDMILMDVQMPEMDGYEATRRIRAMEVPAAKTIPIIAMTANVFKEDVEKCLASGMNGHVGKPLDFEEVLKKLAEYLS